VSGYRATAAFLLIATLGCAKPPSSIAEQKAALIGTWHNGRLIETKATFRTDGTFETTFDAGPGTLGAPSDMPQITSGIRGTYSEKDGKISVVTEGNVFRSADPVTEQKWKSAIEDQKQSKLTGIVAFESPTRLHFVWTNPVDPTKTSSSVSFDKE